MFFNSCNDIKNTTYLDVENNAYQQINKNIYLGLSEGLDGVIPEASHNYYFAGQKWTKLIVVYNDSYTMSFWLKNCDIFDSYADDQKNSDAMDIPSTESIF